MRVTAFIPARGGSKRVPEKNLRRVGPYSLVEHAIRCAVDADVDSIVVSTDDERIAEQATQAGALVHDRLAHLAGDRAQIEDAVIDWLRERARYGDALEGDDAVVILQPTSPLRRPETVRRCIEIMRGAADSVLTVSMDRKSPFRGDRCHDLGEGVYRAIWHRPDGWKRPRTQDVRMQPEENGCVYAVRVRHLLATHSRMGGREYVIPVDAVEAWDIDSPDDLEVARAMWMARYG